MNASEIQKALEWRYATKRFDTSKKISDKDWSTLKEALKMAPSSFGMQPWKFVVVQNPQIREKLRGAGFNQSQFTDASHLVVFATREQIDEKFVQAYIQRVADVRGIPSDSLGGFKSTMLETVNGPLKGKNLPWTQRQAYIAMGFLLETAALLQIDACPMEGFDPNAFDKILGLEGKGWKSVATVALGYRHPEDGYQNMKKVRFADETVIEYVK